jgi:uncharacterized cupredoxin-like copper-binding protein
MRNRNRAALLAVWLLVAACSSEAPAVENTTTVAADPGPTAVEAELARLQTQIDELRAELAAAETAGGPSGPYAIELSDYEIEGDLVVRPGVATFEIVNSGATAHNFVVSGFDRSPDVAAGRAVTWEAADLVEGTYFVYCNLSDHRLRGMSATLVVDPSAGAAHEHEPIDYEAMSAAMNATMLAFPADTAGRGNQPLAPRIAADGAKEFDLIASIIDWEVSPGQIVQAWAYNGMVPGPMIRVEVGDRVRVSVTNQLPMGTDVHFHGVALPNEMDGVAPLTQPLIEPGETFTYEFVAQEPAVAMYHAHHHGSVQIPNGLLGTFFIGEVPLPLGQTAGGRAVPADIELAAEIPMVLNDAGVIGLTLNAKSFPGTEAYHFEVGDWYLVHYFNMGMQVHPMHQHGYFGLVVARDGVPLDDPFWVDTLSIAPAERYSVLFRVTAPGTWMWHCHIQAHVDSEEGMFGMVTAVIAQEGP